MYLIEQDSERDELAANNIKKSLFLLSPLFSDTLCKEARELILKWKVVSKSPYGYSYYDITNKSWEDSQDTPFLRVADHWNFTTRGQTHCRTEDGKNYDGKWVLGEYQPDTKFYKILKVWNKEENTLTDLVNSLSDSELKSEILKVLYGEGLLSWFFDKVIRHGPYMLYPREKYNVFFTKAFAPLFELEHKVRFDYVYPSARLKKIFRI